jgi:hypothetical protein
MADEDRANAIEDIRNKIKAYTTQKPAITWEYCQLARVPPPDTMFAEEALLTFLADGSTINFPADLELDVVSELGANGWEWVHTLVVRDIRWPTSTPENSMNEEVYDLAYKGKAYTYVSLATGVLHFFKRPKSAI